AEALEVTLASDTSSTRVVMVDHPADARGNTVLVSWDHVPSAPDSGALVFRRARSAHEVQYFAIGGRGRRAQEPRRPQAPVRGAPPGCDGEAAGSGPPLAGCGWAQRKPPIGQPYSRAMTHSNISSRAGPGAPRWTPRSPRRSRGPRRRAGARPQRNSRGTRSRR